MNVLLNAYYRIDSRVTKDDDTLFSVTLLPDCEVYKGHFPGNPISPGVCNIQMIKECTELLMGKRLFLTFIDKCRFSAVITPPKSAQATTPLKLQIQLSATGGMNETLADTVVGEWQEAINGEDSALKVRATLFDDTATYIEFRGEFIEMR